MKHANSTTKLKYFGSKRSSDSARVYGSTNDLTKQFMKNEAARFKQQIMEKAGNQRHNFKGRNQFLRFDTQVSQTCSLNTESLRRPSSIVANKYDQEEEQGKMDSGHESREDI